jgi:hypothetical protein
MAQTACSQCNAWYSSERELRDHMWAAHRIFGSGQSNSKPDDTNLKVAAVPPNQPVS